MMIGYKLYSLTPAVSFTMSAVCMICSALTCTAHASSVGEVTLAIGQAMLVPLNGQPLPALRGSKISTGDRIETSEGGHVYIRFLDGALVSVRPTSRLVVEDYQYNPQHVKQSLVRFRLEKGVIRAISGAAAEGAKDRFRLNTPLVAIGVRGTDFVVRAQPSQTIATVNQGAIVMTPFGDNCSRQAFGPCVSASGKLLAADMGNMLVEFKNSSLQAELKPAGSLGMFGTAVAAADVRSGIDTANSREASKPVKQATSDETVSAALTQNVVHGNADYSLTRLLLGRTGTPTVPVATESAQLAWGRWAPVAFDATDFSIAWMDARQGRTVTVGDNDFALYRTQSSVSIISPSLGNINFGLQQGYARFTSSKLEVLPATVLGGQLSIDFSSRQFNTALSLSSAHTGNVSLQTTGTLRDDGLFTSRNATQALAGATAFDGKSAGYFFEKAAATGTLSGITLWSR